MNGTFLGTGGHCSGREAKVCTPAPALHMVGIKREVRGKIKVKRE